MINLAFQKTECKNFCGLVLTKRHSTSAIYQALNDIINLILFILHKNFPYRIIKPISAQVRNLIFKKGKIFQIDNFLAIKSVLLEDFRDFRIFYKYLMFFVLIIIFSWVSK